MWGNADKCEVYVNGKHLALLHCIVAVAVLSLEGVLRGSVKMVSRPSAHMVDFQILNEPVLAHSRH
jgi:hypothetical protein